MSGHSHWHGIKHKKELEDKKRSKIFSKLAKMVSLTARDGDNPNTNSKLRIAIEKAKSFNMPNDNIERAIKKGSGQMPGERLEEFSYEAIGPGKIAIIIEGITDNKNRTLSDIKKILSQFGGKLAEIGSLKWQFQRKGIINVPKEKEELELIAIEAGAEDIISRENFLEIIVSPENLEKIKKELEKENVEIESSILGWFTKEEIEVNDKDKNNIQSLFESLDDNDDVQEIYSNLKV